MTWRDKGLLSVLIWACVYPGVLALSYVFQWLDAGWPLWAELAVSTALTVPLISVVAAPQVERVVAAVRGQTPAELKLEEAREADGPSPEEIVGR